MSDYILKVTTETTRTSEFRVIINSCDDVDDVVEKLKQQMLDGSICSKEIYSGEDTADLKIEVEYEGHIPTGLNRFILDKEEVI